KQQREQRKGCAHVGRSPVEIVKGEGAKGGAKKQKGRRFTGGSQNKKGAVSRAPSGVGVTT
ncbi:MAG TPA: hypothetical protein VGD79_07525, partial [Thermoanaerobaculia bacterium]